MFMTTDALAVRLQWPDEDIAVFPFIWLRDNCPSSFHPQTRERTFDLLSVPADLAPKSIECKNNALTIHWPDTDQVSQFTLDWLKANQPGRRMPDPAAIKPLLWHSDLHLADLPAADAQTLLHDDQALLQWACATKQYGLALVNALDDDPEMGIQIAQRLGFLRETNFGRTFEVISKPDPNNLAYTAMALPLHTDLPNQEMPPGFQFLHCLANSAQGGDSLFCDGFAVAHTLQKQNSSAFKQLCEVCIPLRFYDQAYDIRKRDTVIRLDEDGALCEIRFNAHIAGVFDMEAAHMPEYYQAYRLFMQATRSPDYVIKLRLQAGQMVVFDNRRMLHGRTAFNPGTGLRHLRGCYVDRGEWDSCIRILSRNL